MIILTSFFDALKEFDIFRYALFAGIILGILAPVIGTIVVIRRLSFIADTLSHFSLAGVCFGVFISKILPFEFLDPIIMGIVFSILGTFLIEKLRGFYKNYKELSMPIVMSFGVALSGLFIHLSDGISSKFTTGLLFGSLYAVDLTDLLLIIGISVVIFVIAIIFYKPIITLCFDETYARISGINVKALQLLITSCLAVIISIFIDLVGVLLISSLMILPVATSIINGKSFKSATLMAIIYSEISVICGFIISFYIDLPTSPIVILINIIILVGAMILRRIRSKLIKEKKDEKTPDLT